MYAEKLQNGNYLIYNEDGTLCSRIDVKDVYAQNSQVTTRFEHSSGIVLSPEDVKKLDIRIGKEKPVKKVSKVDNIEEISGDEDVR